MKICLLNKTLDVKGGVGRYGRDIAENIVKTGEAEAIILTEESNGHQLEKAILNKSDLLRNIFNLVINAFKIRKYVKKCDIIHALDGYPYGVIAALANIGLNKKLVINAIGTYSVAPLDKPIKKILMKWAYQKADKILCISSFTAKQILQRIKSTKAVIINHGVNYKKFAEPNFPVGQRENEGKIILSVAGGLKPRKGINVALAAVSQVKKERPAIKMRYYIVGSQTDDPAYFNRLQTQVKDLNLENEVAFLENLSDEQLIKLYYSADLFLLPPVNINNDFEGFGLVYLEAGACGLPAIGTYGCGAEDAIKDGETGWLVPQQDIAKTAEAIMKLLDNPELAKKMGQAGRERARQNDWSQVAKKYLASYHGA